MVIMSVPAIKYRHNVILKLEMLPLYPHFIKGISFDLYPATNKN